QTCCVFPDCMGRKQISPILISQASPDSFPPGEAKALRAAILQTTIYRQVKLRDSRYAQKMKDIFVHIIMFL
ncbi:MAG: hypothetical protein SPI15_07910, partial [Candidatus Faecousia sp.]|nr:hypothetical protein [Clostridiales bacterium]MDY6180766.1 hypothetical protein [Candidatus Faecousia sp.]